MAQWIGQFSGRTHRARVQDREQQLMHALEAYSGATEADRSVKLANLRQIAGKFLRARLQLAHAKFGSQFGNTKAEKAELKRQFEALGVDGVLRELGVEIPAEQGSKE